VLLIHTPIRKVDPAQSNQNMKILNLKLSLWWLLIMESLIRSENKLYQIQSRRTKILHLEWALKWMGMVLVPREDILEAKDQSQPCMRLLAILTTLWQIFRWKLLKRWLKQKCCNKTRMDQLSQKFSLLKHLSLDLNQSWQQSNWPISKEIWTLWKWIKRTKMMPASWKLNRKNRSSLRYFNYHQLLEFKAFKITTLRARNLLRRLRAPTCENPVIWSTTSISSDQDQRLILINSIKSQLYLRSLGTIFWETRGSTLESKRNP